MRCAKPGRRAMRHNPAAGAVVIMLRALKMHGMAQAVGELTEQGSPAFEAALPILSQLLKAETADREVRSTAYQLKAARFPNYRDLAGFDFASSEVNESAPSLRVPGRCSQCRPGRRPWHRQNAPRHGNQRPGHRASPQARPVLLHRRTRQRSRTREASGQTRPDRGAAHPLRSRHPRRAWLPAVQRLRRGLALPSAEQALRAHQRNHHDESQLRRVGHRVRRRQDDDRAARPSHPPLPHSRNRKRQLPFQEQLGESRQTRKGEIPELDERLTPKPSSSRVSSRWKSRVTSQRKSTLGHLAANGAKNTEFIGAVVDITERRLAEEALRSAVADLGRASRLSTMGHLTASIAHEINQPLAAIVTNANACLLWLEADRLNLEQARQAATRIVRNGLRAGDIVKSVRALTRKSTAEMVSLDINDVIREVIVLMHDEFRRHAVRVETSLPPNLGSVVGDRVQLQQVVLNLVMNGIEAMANSMQGQRRLQIRSANDEPGRVLVAVEDSGPGLDVEQTNRLFEAFFTTKPEGMGMGLSISRSIIDAHGGRLWASPNLPNGATFQFTLPAAVGDANMADD